MKWSSQIELDVFEFVLIDEVHDESFCFNGLNCSAADLNTCLAHHCSFPLFNPIKYLVLGWVVGVSAKDLCSTFLGYHSIRILISK